MIRLLLALLLSTLSIQAQTAAPATDSSQPSAAYQSIDPAKAAEIRKMLQVSGTAGQMQRMLDQALAAYRAKNPNISPEFWVQLEKDASVGNLLDKMVPLYDKYYTLDDLKAMNAFYQSPAGQHVLAATPQIVTESSQIGQQWGRVLALKIASELEKEKSAAATAPAPSTTPAAAPAGPGP